MGRAHPSLESHGHNAMNSVLIAGCSFVGVAAGYLNPAPSINHTRFKFFDAPAAGNRAIAARVRHELFRNSYDHVVVLWSGINRVDVPVSRKTHIRTPNDYRYVSVMEDWVWYHSGGIAGSWQSDDVCPAVVKSQFRDQYLRQTDKSATDTTLAAILETQDLLASRKVNYNMCFIYDIHQSYDDTVDKAINTKYRTIGFDRWPLWLALEHCLGKVNTTSGLYNMVDWDKFNSGIPPYEYCAERNLQQIDRFHPTPFGMAEWFETQLNIDLTS